MRRVIDNERRAVNVCLHPLTHNTHTHTDVSCADTHVSQSQNSELQPETVGPVKAREMRATTLGLNFA